MTDKRPNPPFEETLSGRLLNACERICEGLEPREHCAELFLEAYKRIQALEDEIECLQGELDIAEGRWKYASEFFDELREKADDD